MPKNRVVSLRLSTAGLLAPFILSTLLAGCAVAPTHDNARLLESVPRAELERAAGLERRGKASDAAELYIRLAKGAGRPTQAQLQILATRAYLSAGRVAQAKKAIGSIAEGSLTPGQRDEYMLLQGDLALSARLPREALSYLRRVNPDSLSKDVQIQWLGSVASAERQSGSMTGAAGALDRLDGLLEHKEERLTNQVSLVSALASMSRGELQTLARSGRGNMKGWAEIALFTQDAEGNSARLENSYRSWGRTHMLHPALAELGRALSGSMPGGYSTTTRVMVVLPRAGRFASAADAIRKGIEAANSSDSGTTRPSLDFSSSLGTLRAKTGKEQNAVDYVIGPLEKPSVDKLMEESGLRVPTLALNESSRSGRRVDNLYQFSLSPENEANEAARKAHAMGLKRALVVHPDGEWGIRLARAFQAQWSSLGGTLAAQVRYVPGSTKGEGEVVKRMKSSDADLVFLVATAEGARRLHPALRSAASGSVVIMSTSHVYTGDFDAKRDAGLVGLYFVDIPWMLDSTDAGPLSRRSLTSGADPLARLCAMGIDAYRLAPRLAALSKNPGSYFQGQTGGLSLDTQGRVRRQLALARFTESGPQRTDSKGR